MTTLKDLVKKDEALDAADPQRLPAWTKRKGSVDDSIALIAMKDGRGIILAHHGDDIEASFEGDSSPEASTHGLDEAADGLCLWEGRYVERESHTPDGHEFDYEPKGTYRAMNHVEWTNLRLTGCPWELQK